MNPNSRILARCSVALGILVVTESCARSLQKVQIVQGAPAVIDELWQEPADFTTRDLFHCTRGSRLLPKDRRFTFVARDTSGWSPGFDVRDQNGLEWSVKLGPEAQSEVVSSRILWAMGFHQPPAYYMETWSLAGQITGPQDPGRFRPSLPGQEVISGRGTRIHSWARGSSAD